MTINSNKIYEVVKYTENQTFDYGMLTGKDVKSVIGTAKYDEETEMWFTPKATIGYQITEME